MLGSHVHEGPLRRSRHHRRPCCPAELLRGRPPVPRRPAGRAPRPTVTGSVVGGHVVVGGRGLLADPVGRSADDRAAGPHEMEEIGDNGLVHRASDRHHADVLWRIGAACRAEGALDTRSHAILVPRHGRRGSRPGSRQIARAETAVFGNTEAAGRFAMCADSPQPSTTRPGVLDGRTADPTTTTFKGWSTCWSRAGHLPKWAVRAFSTLHCTGREDQAATPQEATVPTPSGRWH